VSDAFDPMNPMNPLSAINALNTATRALMDNIKRAGFPPLHKQGAQMARQSYRMGVGASEVPRAPMARIENFSIPARSGHSIPARLWAPLDAPGLPVMLYLHGGGFVIGGIDTCEAMCRSVAALEKAGVSAAVKVYEGTVHDFINMGRFLPQAAQAHADMAQALRHALA